MHIFNCEEIQIKKINIYLFISDNIPDMIELKILIFIYSLMFNNNANL